ncbi:MAG TPA: SCP2 sterol-binding domain-containing protein [Acidimicrobiales bacterium]|nr:SCP2 sterol-binding domain-containing protein [Acidimicrobiales bacterium]
MVTYLSAAWFRELGETSVPSDAPVVLRQVVTGAPDGDVRYDVAVSGSGAVIVPVDENAESREPDLTFSSDYPTACAVAAGRLSTHAALAAGRLRVRGDLSRVSQRADAVGSGLDPVPPALRAVTEFPILPESAP